MLQQVKHQMLPLNHLFKFNTPAILQKNAKQLQVVWYRSCTVPGDTIPRNLAFSVDFLIHLPILFAQILFPGFVNSTTLV